MLTLYNTTVGGSYTFQKDGAFFSLTPEEMQSMVSIATQHGFVSRPKWKWIAACVICAALGWTSPELLQVVLALL